MKIFGREVDVEWHFPIFHERAHHWHQLRFGPLIVEWDTGRGHPPFAAGYWPDLSLGHAFTSADQTFAALVDEHTDEFLHGDVIRIKDQPMSEVTDTASFVESWSPSGTAYEVSFNGHRLVYSFREMAYFCLDCRALCEALEALTQPCPGRRD